MSFRYNWGLLREVKDFPTELSRLRDWTGVFTSVAVLGPVHSVRVPRPEGREEKRNHLRAQWLGFLQEVEVIRRRLRPVQEVGLMETI